MRTTGSVEPYADLNLKRDIEAGRLAGPHIDVTGPYLEGATSPYIQMYRLKDADDARQLVNYWADRGATSFKAYTNITREESDTPRVAGGLVSGAASKAVVPSFNPSR